MEESIKSKEDKMKKKILTIKAGTKEGDTIIQWLLTFRYDDLLLCPKEKPFDFRAKKIYSLEEQRILNMIPNLKKGVNLRSPTVCSGIRGDGSSYRRKCKFFDGYGDNKDKVWNFLIPQKYVWCTKANGRIYTKQVTTDCGKHKLVVTIARTMDLIYHFGSACLEIVFIEECLKCSYKTNKGCSWKPRCKKGNFILYSDCKWGDCDTCEERGKNG